MPGPVAHADLHRLIVDVLLSYDVLPEHATITADRMLDADLRGREGHGIIRLPQYAKRFDAGGYNLRPDIRTIEDAPARALIDGDDGIGHVVVTTAVRLAVAKALDQGIALVGTRRSNHAGAAGVYAAMALEHDLVCIYMAIGNANHLAPWGGTDRLLSTNPIAIAIPTRQRPAMVLDMATTVTSHGRIAAAADRGESIPAGWVEDLEGNPITDPHRADEGLLLPIGDYKGFGLGLAVGAIAGVLNGAAFGSEVVDFTHDFRTSTNTGQTVLMIRPDLFGPIDRFTAAMDERLAEMADATPMPGRGPVRIPGAEAPALRARLLAEGIPLTDALRGRLRDLATRRGVDGSMLD